MAELTVELVAVERRVWSGEATMVSARTTEGELGVLPGHSPLLGELVDGGVVTITTTDGDTVTAAVHGGFLSVTPERVSVLAEVAELSNEIDVGRARDALQRTESGGSDEDSGEVAAARARAEARLRAAGESV